LSSLDESFLSSLLEVLESFLSDDDDCSSLLDDEDCDGFFLWRFTGSLDDDSSLDDSLDELEESSLCFLFLWSFFGDFL
jgi:hypothetical protein